MKEINLHQTNDAMTWAKECVRINPILDLGFVHSWFANLIMCGHDHASRKHEKRVRFCAGLISTMDQFKDKHPLDVYEWICEEADKNDQ